jgi:predicted nucleic acid-binding protein
MKVFVDSSALAKRYVKETGSGQMREILNNTSELAFSIILVPEIVSALNRRLREKRLAKDDYQNIKNKFIEDVNDAVVLQLTPDVVNSTIKLLEQNILRAMDALHIACALEWKCDLFVTADKRQLKTANREGLQTAYLG